MISKPVQRRNALIVVGTCLLLLPLLALEGESLPSNNNVETWLPKDSQVRREYDFFKESFGGEEMILIGLELDASDPLVESIAGRIQERPEFRVCWSPTRLRDEMTALGVSADRAESQITGLTLAEDGGLVGLAAFLSDEGIANRAQAVHAVHDVLDYCQIDSGDVLLTGAPVVVTELDRLGGVAANRFFFGLALFFCVFILWGVFREWRLTTGIVVQAVFAIEVSQAVLKWMGGEMSFVLTALPVMVMVFTMSNAIHVVHYFRASAGTENPIRRTILGALKPCSFATLTTMIGLISLRLSDIGPVQEFGLAGAIGAFVALSTALTITPALLVLFPQKELQEASETSRLMHWGQSVIGHPIKIATVSIALIVFCAFGFAQLKSHIDPLDFLPRNNVVLRDLLEVEERLTPVDSIEVIVDFGTEPLNFMQKLDRVRVIETQVAAYPEVQHTMSLASFFPDRLPEGAFESARFFSRALGNENRLDYMATGERFWRISARIKGETARAEAELFGRLQHDFADQPILLTGIASVIQQAQMEIFVSFWQSLTSALGVILLVMIIALRAPLTAVIAMVPNVAPILIVFGLLGWSGCFVDIGMMMTASIALGIAVDGTLHFLVSYQGHFRDNRDTVKATRYALFRTGAPIMQAALVAGLGMLPLMLSSFAPTVRFGGLMAVTLMVAMIGDVVLLPALFCLRPNYVLGWLKRPKVVPAKEKEIMQDPWLNPPHVHLAPMKVGKI